jgi:hypothetical protein
MGDNWRRWWHQVILCLLWNYYLVFMGR